MVSTQIAGYVVTAIGPSKFELEGPMAVYSFDSVEKLKDFLSPSEFSDGYLAEVEEFLTEVREHFSEEVTDLVAEFETALASLGPTIHYDEKSGWKMLDRGTEPVFYRATSIDNQMALVEYGRSGGPTEQLYFTQANSEAAASLVAEYVQ